MGRRGNRKEMQFKIVNVVAKLQVGQQLNVKHLVYAIPGRYSEKVFPASVTKSRNPKVTVSAFGSGELVLAGAKSEDDALIVAYRYVALLRKRLNNPLCAVRDFRVTNTVSSVTNGHEVNVDLFYDDHRFESTYKPDKFIGLTWRTVIAPADKSVDEAKLAFVLFETGKVVVSGIKHHLQHAMALKKLENICNYEKGKEYRVIEAQRRRTRKRKAKGKEWE